MGSKVQFNEILSRCISKHGDKYAYIEDTYCGTNKPMSIICNTHGEFKQRPVDHIAGQNCPECGKINRKISQTDTATIFINKAKAIHLDKYDYSLVNYTKSDNKVIIICPEHGEFTKTPNKHITGQGCPKCNNAHRRTQEDFIQDCINVHGNKYDYSKAVYKTGDDSVTIICPEHGGFQQTPYTHIKRQSGCPSCSIYGFKYNSSAILYYLKISTKKGFAYKIGITNKTVEERFLISELNNIEVICQKEFATGYEAFKIEQEILKNNKEFAYKGQKILISNGNTELFNEDILNRIKKYFI